MLSQRKPILKFQMVKSAVSTALKNTLLSHGLREHDFLHDFLYENVYKYGNFEILVEDTLLDATEEIDVDAPYIKFQFLRYGTINIATTKFTRDVNSKYWEPSKTIIENEVHLLLPPNLLKLYAQNQIPKEVWEFFATQDSLNVNQLLDIQYDRYWACRLINKFHAFPLILFYRDTEGLRVSDLLNFGGYAIRELVVFDKDYQFQKWLLANELTMPKELCENWHYIPQLCKENGLEYLNKRILSLPKADRQKTLNYLVSLGNPEFQEDFELTLNNDIVSDKTVACFSIWQPVAKHKNKEKPAEEMANRNQPS